MKLDPFGITAVYWYAQFRKELSLRNSEAAEEYFKLSLYWKRRSKLYQTLAQICKQKNFCQEKKYGKRNRHA